MTPLRTAALSTLSLMTIAGLFAPAAGGATKPMVSASPDAGAVAVSQAVFRTRGGSAAPRLVLTRRAALPAGTLVVGGVKKLRRGRYVASFAVVRRGNAGSRAHAAAAVAVRATLRMPRRVRFGGFVSRAAANDVANRAAPRALCRSLPSSFSHGGVRPLAGPPLPGYDARTTLRNAFWLGCRDWPGRTEFLAALRARGVEGSGGGATGGGGSAGGEDEAGSGDGSVPPECRDDLSACDPEDGPSKSTTLTGSGSVTRDANDPNVYRYSVQFNEPVRGYRFEVSRVSIECPSREYYENYARCEALGDAQRPSAGGADLRCGDSQFTYEVQCAVTQSRSREAATIPAGTTITGSFSVNAGTVRPGAVQVYGEAANGGEAASPFALSGPE
jgi:hypothetical protein